jgi:hypothetical protein
MRTVAVIAGGRAPEAPEGASTRDYVRLGPLLGEALVPRGPRLLLVDELDKSDFDLPNDLLEISEDGRRGRRAAGERPSAPPNTTRSRPPAP